MSLPRVAQGEVAVIAEVALDLPDVPAPGQLNIVANIANDETHYGNDWSAWVYPAEIRPAESAVPVFAAESCSKALSKLATKPIPTAGELASRSRVRDRRPVRSADRRRHESRRQRAAVGFG